MTVSELHHKLTQAVMAEHLIIQLGLESKHWNTIEAIRKVAEEIEKQIAVHPDHLAKFK